MVGVHGDPTPSTRQHVLAACGNQCAFPGCSERIFDLEHSELIGVIAHIKARSPNGARYDSAQTEEENRSFENLFALCRKHNTIIDGNKSDLYPVSKLYKMKKDHEEKIAKESDRKWIKPPNSILKMNLVGVPEQTSYWIDRTGKARLYTIDQLAKCNILMDIYLSLSKVCSLIENLPKMNDTVTIENLKQQDFAKFNTSATSVIGHFVQLMAATPDITFSEFIGFISQGNDPTALATLGAEKLKKVIEGIDPDVKSFFKSDKLDK